MAHNAPTEFLHFANSNITIALLTDNLVRTGERNCYSHTVFLYSRSRSKSKSSFQIVLNTKGTYNRFCIEAKRLSCTVGFGKKYKLKHFIFTWNFLLIMVVPHHIFVDCPNHCDIPGEGTSSEQGNPMLWKRDWGGHSDTCQRSWAFSSFPIYGTTCTNHVFPRPLDCKEKRANLIVNKALVASR